jgi:peptide/nickel transport system permease protein
MRTYLIRRLIYAFVTLFLVTLSVFFVIRLLPGDPLTIYISQTAGIDSMSDERKEQLRKEYGLDKPILIQYINWLKDIARGDLGTSIFYRDHVKTLIRERLPRTLHLGLMSLGLNIIVGLTVGMVAAIRRARWPDKILTPLTYLGITIPAFWLGILMIYVFGLRLGWLPIAGYTSPTQDFWLSMKQSVMPVICMSLWGIASSARQMRSSMLEVIQQDYIRTAWSKGLSEREVIQKHALKNSLLPVITTIAMGVSMIFGGSVIIESVFAIPGMGSLMVHSIFGQDYVVVQAITLVIAVIVLSVNLIVDVFYGFLDPRIRYD